MTNRNDIADNISQGLGALVWWDLDRTAIKPADLRAILAAEGDSTVVPDVNPLKGLKRAVGAFSMGRGNQPRYRANVAFEDDDEIVVGIVTLQKAGPRKVVWPQVASFHFDKATEALTVRNGPAEHDDAVQSFGDLAAKMMTHLDHQWIRPNLIQDRLNSWGGFSLRRQGGVTFVPSQFLPELETLGRIVGAIGDSALHVAHVEATSASRASISNSARTSLDGAFGQLREQLDDWLAGTCKARPSSVSGMLADFAELRDRALLYRDTLEMAVDDLMAEISEAKVTAQELLGERQADSSNAGRKLTSRTVAKLEALFQRASDDGTVTVDANALQAVNLGVSWLYTKANWAPGGLAAVEAERFGLRTVASSRDQVVLGPA